MAARSAWAGPITFAGFPFNVKAYPLIASASKDKVKTLCTCHGTPIRAPKVCGTSGKELTPDQMQKGVEKSKDAYAVVNGDALDAASGPKSNAIVPERVVHMTTVPLHLTMSAWRLVPEPGHEQSVGALQAILEQSGKALEVPGFVSRSGSPDTVLVVYGRDGELLASTIADKTKLNARPAVTLAAALPDAQLGMLRQALDSLYPLADFDVNRFDSQHAAKRAAAIAAAVAGKSITPAKADAPAVSAVPDLMAALEASLKAAKTNNREPIAA